MAEHCEGEQSVSLETWVSEYKDLLRRRYEKILDREQRVPQKEGCFLYEGDWRTVEEIEDLIRADRKRKNAILFELLLLLAALTITILFVFINIRIFLK